MEIDTKLIKELRDKTSAGVMDCKKALEETEGNVEQAASLLRSKGIASAAKKAERDTDQGVIATYIHSGGRIGSMVEVNCETDFVARTDDFLSLPMTLQCKLLQWHQNLSAHKIYQKDLKIKLKRYAYYRNHLLKILKKHSRFSQRNSR